MTKNESGDELRSGLGCAAIIIALGIFFYLITH